MLRLSSYLLTRWRRGGENPEKKEIILLCEHSEELFVLSWKALTSSPLDLGGIPNFPHVAPSTEGKVFWLISISVFVALLLAASARSENTFEILYNKKETRSPREE